jgi:hypothetical protein
MTQNGIDTGTSQRNLDFGLARRMGMESNYVKLGGDNSGRYVAPNYISEVDRSRAAGMRVGHYWVPSSAQDPAGAAEYFVSNLRGWTPADFVVLDNESLDGVGHYSDDQAAAWVNTVKARLGIGGRQVKVYLGLSVANSTTWDAVLNTGCGIIIAAYSYSPFAYSLRTIPGNRNEGHQVGGIVIGGISTDLDVWQDNAFDYAGSTPASSPASVPISSPSTSAGIPRSSTEDDGITGPIFNKRLQLWGQRYGGYTGPLDGVMGPNSWSAVQRNLARESGYTGPIDGVPGQNTWKAVQRWASHYGYTGPVDGQPGPNTWRAVAKALNTL